jgi:hypothetical protein
MRRRRGLTALTGVLAAAACLFALASAQAAFGPLGQQRISHMGPDGDPTYAASRPALAYNPTADEYLVVWDGTDSAPGLGPTEREIYAQRLSDTGAPLGGRFRVSEQGADGDATFSAGFAKVAYNGASNEYLVVWEGDTGVAGEKEIWGQRLSASGAEAGGNDFRISEMGPDNNVAFGAHTPRIAVNTTTGEYLVTWNGNDGPPLANGETEIYGQLLTSAGAATGTNDFRISAQGADGDPNSQVGTSSVAYNATTNEYLAAWQGEIGSTDEVEVWSRRLSATGAPLGGADDTRISEMGPDGNSNYPAQHTNVVANPVTGGYLVIWTGNDGPPLSFFKFEIYGQLLTAAGEQTGSNDFRISETGPETGMSTQSADLPNLTVDPLSGEYLAVWRGDAAAEDEDEIYGQRLRQDGADIGGDFRISHMGPDGSTSYTADSSAVTADTTRGEYFAAWDGTEGTPAEREIHVSRIGVPAPLLTGTSPAGPANDNDPRVKASIPSVDPASTIDVFANASCSGTPAVNDAPAGDLIGSGIAVSVADNSTTSFAVTATISGRTSRCSNSVTYTEQTPAPPPPPPPPVDKTAPVVSGFVVVPAKVRVKKSSSFRFRLSEKATAQILIERSLPGRRVGKRCVARRRKNAKRARCVRFKRVVTLTFRNRPAGQSKVVFRPRIGKRAFALGPYRATVIATDAAGNRSTPKRASFKVVRR